MDYTEDNTFLYAWGRNKDGELSIVCICTLQFIGIIEEMQHSQECLRSS